MSKSTQYNAANDAKIDAALADAKTEEKTVPAQSTGDNHKKLAAAVHSAVAADTMIDALATVEDRLAEGVTVKVTVDEDGKVHMEVVEDTKVKSLAGKAKGLFKRNKKMVLATAGLLVTSAVLKVIVARRDELEEGEIVESSDDVSVDA